MKTLIKIRISSFLLAVALAVISGCASEYPEQNVEVSDASTNSYAKHEYKAKTTWNQHFNFMYEAMPFESVAYYKDYNKAGRTKFDTNLDELVSNYLAGTNVATALTNVNNVIKTQLQNQRNDFLFKYMKVISRNYGIYVAKITGYSASFNVLSDSLMLGGNAVAALTPAASTKTVWNVALGAFGGAKLSGDKNFFLNQSVLLLSAKMEQNRVQERELIRGKMTNSIDAFPLSEAALDLEDLYEAGSLIKVLQNISLNTPATTNILVNTNMPAGATPPTAPSQTGTNDISSQMRNVLLR